MKFLRDHGLCYVSVDAPASPSVMPSFLAVTEPQAYIRFHGRNREHWFKWGVAVAERRKYLYSGREPPE